MAKERFKIFNFKSGTLALIAACVEIINDYQSQGYKLTLRQLYYQLVTKNIIANLPSEYDRLGTIANNARLAGLIDWDMIEDRTRNLRGTPHKEKPEDAIRQACDSYFRDKWETQKNRVEVWIEKDALAGIFSRVCSKLDIDYFSCRGYTSQSAMYSAAKRHAHYIENKQTPVILHFGDHDASGLDMTRDIRERLELFNYGEPILVDRLALNMEQVHAYKPPPNPVKESDSRSPGYTRIYGVESWELDALPPDVLAGLVERAVKQFIEPEAWEAAEAREKAEKESLKHLAGDFEEIKRYLSQSRGVNPF